ncbi:MAG: GNAT family N-acetyltransferase [Bryobacteraceae bacterium]|nr:GNAT family N-acetyltransferase [Bryobacteraceae bacterium]
MAWRVRAASAGDSGAIARIYNHYVRTTTVTFEESAVSSEDMSGRVEESAAAGLPFLIAESGDEVLGFAFASKWKGRCAYRFSVEVSVYVDPARGRQGIGSALYEVLFAELESKGMHAAIGGIALPNEASIALHEKFGLRKVAHFEEVGFKFGRWVDVGYWQRVF